MLNYEIYLFQFQRTPIFASLMEETVNPTLQKTAVLEDVTLIALHLEMVIHWGVLSVVVQWIDQAQKM